MQRFKLLVYCVLTVYFTVYVCWQYAQFLYHIFYIERCPLTMPATPNIECYVLSSLCITLTLGVFFLIRSLKDNRKRKWGILISFIFTMDVLLVLMDCYTRFRCEQIISLDELQEWSFALALHGTPFWIGVFLLFVPTVIWIFFLYRMCNEVCLYIKHK